MYYELYVDSLFVLNFTMNLYLLILVDQSLMRTATRKRIFLGAGVGAFSYLLPFMIPLPIGIKFPLALLAGTWLMIYIAFRPKGMRGIWEVLKRLFIYSFLLGGLLLFAMRALPFVHTFLTEIAAVCLLGAMGTMILRFLIEKNRNRALQSSCKATLICGETKIVVQALLDSGNSLVEPISGKPVSVIEKSVYQRLWGEVELPFRAIPYQSIGRKRGILRGYLLPELEIEMDGVTRHLADVYVAVGEESGHIPLIVNPAVLG